MSKSLLIGVDIGGSHITAGSIDLVKGSLDPSSLSRRELDGGSSADYILDVWSEAILTSINGQQQNMKLGIAIPGPFDYLKGISYIRNQGKFDALYGLNVKKILAKRLSVSEYDIHLMNDAACFLQGEVYAGAAKGFNSAIGVTLGTGLGSAVFSGGSTADADLWKYPFKDGIAEDYLCARWLVKTYKHYSGRSVAGVKDLVEEYETDFFAKSTFADFSDNLAEFLSLFIDSENPQVVVLGGNISKAYHLFVSDLKKQLATHDIVVPIVPAQLGEQAAIIGAAAYWLSKEEILANKR